VYGQTNPLMMNTNSTNLFENAISQYASGIRFKDVLPVAIGILGFSYFIWKTASILSKREVFPKKFRYEEKTHTSLTKTRIFYAVKYIIFFPMIMYGWVVVCFLFMYALNTSLSYDALSLIMVGIIAASRISAHWNEKLAENIMKFLPFNLMFTLLLNPNLNYEKIIDSIPDFLPIMIQLTIFIGFTGALEGILKLIYYIIHKIRHPSDDDRLPIKST
jgi:hypothetical protein